MMGEVCVWGGDGSHIIMPLERPSLCTSLTGVKCVCVNSLWLCLQWLAVSV